MSSKKCRILVVDDVPDNLFLIQTFLQTEGYEVEVADNAIAAFESIQISPPDLVLLDVMMPGTNGYELTRKIRRDSNFRSIPIVLVTASIEACRVKGLAVGATEFVRKPIDLEELLSIIEQLLYWLSKQPSSHYSISTIE
ncbi:MAG: response regulator [Oscillatoriales cyanobacterium C42_A2020_001]|nr:response regulator [Leptolyngbyaceae cyanobacterium C42_A2020_001]